ncbi:MAG: hypothetical protein R2932_10600 [Caldilineaceae bacterium]
MNWRAGLLSEEALGELEADIDAALESPTQEQPLHITRSEA